MKRFALSFVLSLAVATPALAAEVTTFQGDDEHLYLNQAREDVTTYGAGWNRYGGGVSGYSGSVYQTFISKGQVRISDDRFLEIIEQSNASPYFISKVQSRQAVTSGLAVTTLVGLGLSVGAAFLTRYLVAEHSRQTATRDENGVSSYRKTDGDDAGIAAFGIGLCIDLIPMAGWISTAQSKLFTNEEAYDAIKAYNRQLDSH